VHVGPHVFGCFDEFPYPETRSNKYARLARKSLAEPAGRRVLAHGMD
jgi:hypothetical protein